MPLNEKNLVEGIFTLKWNSFYAHHEDKYFIRLNVWREFNLLPEIIRDHLSNIKEGEKINLRLEPGHLFPFSDRLIFEIDPRVNFKPPDGLSHIRLRLGRFYPLGFFRFLPGIFRGNPYPGRIISVNGDKKTLLLDGNHPLSRYSISFEVEVLKIVQKERELGGRCRDWIEEAFRIGPGMQARYDHLPTDFELDKPEAFRREDESKDIFFYAQPRFVGHIDRVCHQNLVEYYGKILPKKGKILDLMSGYESHLPEGDYEVVGLGLNIWELKANLQLNSFVIKDINEDPSLPFESESFDVVVCDLSIEYITKPIAIINEIKRVLKPGGIVSFSFSNRYFPSKVIKLWIDLHEFERMGYVLELLIRTGFKDLHTYSIRGFPRPIEDRWSFCTQHSDPLYVVWGRK